YGILQNLTRCPLDNTLTNHRDKSPITIDVTENKEDKLDPEHKDIHEDNDTDSVNVDPFDVEIESLRLQRGLKSTRRRKIVDQRIIVIDLSYEEMLSERDKDAKRDSYINAAYKCDTCLIGFNYKNSHKAHVTAKHSPIVRQIDSAPPDVMVVKSRREDS
ncbi:hypothetical protein evm_014877, partial [Chilo suppressalis]